MKYLPCLLWVPFMVLKAVLILAGLIIVPIALLTQRMGLHQDGADHEHWPDLFWLWGNDEEQCPDWWLDRAANGKENKVAGWFPRFWWYAIKNPANNMRFLFKDVEGFQEDSNWPSNWTMEAPVMLRNGQAMAYRYRWSGWKSGYRRVWLHGDEKYTELYVGWKLGNAVPGLGITMQYRRKRKIGT
jgi:hypothetical protein